MANRAFESARNKGRQAFLAGQGLDANPYGDDRTTRGGVTFARAFWRTWREGWKEACRESQKTA